MRPALFLSFLLAACGGSSHPKDAGGGPAEDAGPDADAGDAVEDAGGGDDAGRNDSGPPMPLVFAGIETAAWDGADGLVGTWPAAETPLEASYTLEVTSLADGSVRTAETPDLSTAVTGLADGEYRLRTIARTPADEESDGGRSLVQLVGSNRLVPRGNLPMLWGASVWGEGEIVVQAGWESGISFRVVDASDPVKPEVLTEVVDGGYVKEMKIADGLLFTNGECGCEVGTPAWDAYDRIGARIWDFADPANPILLGTVGPPASSVHNVWYDDGWLYLTDNTTYSVAIYDASDPAAPVLSGYWAPPSGLVHDQIVLDDKLYVAWWNGFAIVDVSDPSSPVDEVVHAYGPAADVACHNVWPTEDRQYVLTTDELWGGGYLRVWDVADPGDVQQVASWWTDLSHTIHNVHVRGDYAFIAYYVDGVVVLDVSDPTVPVEVGRYDTFDEAAKGGGPWWGAWGVWPYGPHVAVGDTTTGLHLLDHFPEVVAAE